VRSRIEPPAWSGITALPAERIASRRTRRAITQAESVETRKSASGTLKPCRATPITDLPGATSNPPNAMLILVADDSPAVRRMVTARLIADGHEITEAEDGKQALELALEQPPDAMVLDKVMPKLDGFEVVRRLREHEATRDLPIVMLTGSSREDDVLGGLELGVDEYMPKPFSPRELSVRVARLLNRAGRSV
jgi:CheY-like chemotaxis protein